MSARSRVTLALSAAAFAAACSNAQQPGPTDGPPAAEVVANGISYRASTQIMESFPVQLRTTVDVHNATGAPVRVVFPDGCVVLLRAFPQGATTVAWDQRRTVGCTAALVDVTLAAGESRSWETRTDAREILGDSLPDGRYRLEAYLRPQGGPIAVAAGTADLAVPR